MKQPTNEEFYDDDKANAYINYLIKKYADSYREEVRRIILKCVKEIKGELSTNCQMLILAAVFMTLIAETKARLLGPLSPLSREAVLKAIAPTFEKGLKETEEEFEKFCKEQK